MRPGPFIDIICILKSFQFWILKPDQIPTADTIGIFFQPRALVDRNIPIGQGLARHVGYGLARMGVRGLYVDPERVLLAVQPNRFRLLYENFVIAKITRVLLGLQQLSIWYSNQVPSLFRLVLRRNLENHSLIVFFCEITSVPDLFWERQSFRPAKKIVRVAVPLAKLRAIFDKISIESLYHS